ncbi:MAG TPA: AAA family ATPase [Candidatus Elarobacter sp.]|nr:AAA family ATPase [Candidatus Elarobacter sp.]
MRFHSLRVDGFGRIADRTFGFGPGLNVVVGPNEAGKSTLAAALVASLYGLQRGEKERWRPWTGSAYATVLTYQTADGQRWEVHRAYDRDTKGVRVYDADGTDASARLGNGKALAPGDAQLGISLDVFLQTAYAPQRALAFDGATAGEVSTALAHALDGGPKEDAALGALARLDDALRKHVGTERAHKNAPLRTLREEHQRRCRAADDARSAVDALAGLRVRIGTERTEHERDAAAAAELERRVRALRAARLQARLAALAECRDELSAVQSAREAYDDVQEFAAERVGLLDDAFHSWRSAESVAGAAAVAVVEERLTAAESAELTERIGDAGTFDDDAFEALCAAGAQADAAHARAAAAANDAAAARRDVEGGRSPAGVILVFALIALAIDVGLAIAHAWLWSALASAFAIAFGGAAYARGNRHADRRKEAEDKQRTADLALADEQRAAHVVAAVLEPLGIANLGELARRRERYLALRGREHAALKTEVRAHTAAAAVGSEAERFDALAAALVADVDGDRAAKRAAARQRAARRHERDGLDARLAMLTVRRGDILLGDDEFALQAEYDQLLADGVAPATNDDAALLRALERERAELDERAREAERSVATLEGALRAGESNVPSVAELDEAVAQTQAEIDRLVAFERAVKLARRTIDARKEEAHRAFARRLEEYSAGVLAAISGGRYGEIFVNPATLEINVRVPETGAIEPLEKLSAGTRDQIALVVRFATARMFAEGLETPPILLDDPFAYWDAERVERCLPALFRGALDAQCILFTASNELGDAAVTAGATRIELGAVLAVS